MQELDLQLRPKDQLFVFSVNENRPATLSEIVGKLVSQAKLDRSAEIVYANGTVRFPGAYPLTQSMNLLDLLAATGGLTEEAFLAGS